MLEKWNFLQLVTQSTFRNKTTPDIIAIKICKQEKK
jgi:hypothetical protein